MPTRDPKKTPMTRQELYDLVWSEPMRKVAPRFYCSDSWLAKICRRCGVPTPPRGYWAKKEAGKRAYRRKLAKNLDPEEVVLYVHTTTEPEPPPPPDDTDVADALLRASELPKKWTPEKGKRSHPLATESRKVLKPSSRTRGINQYDWVSRGREGEWCPLNIDVSKGCVDRALRAMDALLKAFADQGFESLAVREGRFNDSRLPKGAYTIIVGEAFTFRIRERLKMNRLPEGERDRYGSSIEWEHTGKLELELRNTSSV